MAWIVNFQTTRARHCHLLDKPMKKISKFYLVFPVSSVTPTPQYPQ